MKTLGQIIDDVKDGAKPDYEDLRYAVIALDALRHFNWNSLHTLATREKAGKYRADLFGLQHAVEERFNQQKAAFAVPPKQYVGTSHDPDTEECQRWRKMSKNILKKVMEKQQ